MFAQWRTDTNQNTEKIEMSKRNRKTREEMLAFRLAQVEKLQAQIDGSFQDESENAVLRSLNKRLRKTQTALRAAGITLNGTEVRSPIADKIAGTEKRLAAQVETMKNAEAYVASLPFDVERLEALIAASEQGDDVEFPKDLTNLGDEQERTDEEHEAAFIATEEANPED